MPSVVTADASTPLIAGSIETNEAGRVFSDLLIALKRLIEQHELSPLDGEQSPDGNAQLSCLNTIIEKIEKFILFNRACSCSFRFKSTNHAGLEIFQIARQHGKFTSITSTVCALLFFLTDAGVTVSTAKNSVAMLKNLFGEVKTIMNSLRDDSGKLPLARIIILFALLPGGMWGSYNKGFVGVQAITELITSFFTNNSPYYLNILFNVISCTVGVSSALCFVAFNMRNGLGILRTTRVLFSSDLWSEYMNTKKKAVYFDQAVTFLISIAMTLITLLATFYAKGSFEITWRTASEALFIGLSNLTLNTFFTTGPNYIIKTIKAQCNALEPEGEQLALSGCDRAGKIGLQMTGVISSLGNSFAVLPAIIFIMILASKEQDLTKQSTGSLVAALMVWMLLSIPMFLRDYAYYTKPLLEWLEKRQRESILRREDSASASAIPNLSLSQEQRHTTVSQSTHSFFQSVFSNASNTRDAQLDLNFS